MPDLMTWMFSAAADEWAKLDRYADRLTHVGLFYFRMPDTTGRILDEMPQIAINELRAGKHPHLNWMLTVRNDGYPHRFGAIGTPGPEQDRFISDLADICARYPEAGWLDIDLERGEELTADEFVALCERIKRDVAVPYRLKMNIDLPPMQGDGVPYWEAWCDYAKLEPIFDRFLIMSYAFAWAGSAAGPISPKWWMKDTYDYAVTRIPPEKLLLGTSAFGIRWPLHPRDDEVDGRRGVGGQWYHWHSWMQGVYSHTDGRGTRPNTQTQPYAGWAGEFDEDSWHARVLPHVYDERLPADFTLHGGPVLQNYIDRDYLVSTNYRRVEFVTNEHFLRTGSTVDEFDGYFLIGSEADGGWVSVGDPAGTERDGSDSFTGDGTQDPDTLEWSGTQTYQLSINGDEDVVVGSVTVSPDQGSFTVDYDAGKITFDTPPADGETFTVAWTAIKEHGYGRWDLAVPAGGGGFDLAFDVSFPWFDRNRLEITVNGTRFTLGGPDAPQWYPLRGQLHRLVVNGVQLAGDGNDYIELLGVDQGSAPGARIYNIGLADQYSTQDTGGNAKTSLSLGELVDVDGVTGYPDGNQFKGTLEVLRRPPDPAPCWEDYFVGPQYVHGEPPPSGTGGYVWTGQWIVVDFDGEGDMALEGGGDGQDARIDVAYDSFEQCHVQAQFWIGPDTRHVACRMAGYEARWQVDGTVKLLDQNNGGTELASSTGHATLDAGDLVTLQIRIRGGLADVYLGSGTSRVIKDVAVSTQVGYAGVGVGGPTQVRNIVVGDSHVYRAMEAVIVKTPDGETHYDVGRIPRVDPSTGESLVTYDGTWTSFFTLNDPTMEELDTRREDPNDPSSSVKYSISNDWQYVVSPAFVAAPGDHRFEVHWQDLGIWLSRAVIGDADGFSEIWYGDWQTLIRYRNWGVHDYGLVGAGFWQFTSVDPRVFPHLPPVG